MQRYHPASQRRSASRSGFTLVETAMSVLLVGILLTAALTSVGASKRRETSVNRQLQGQQLASDLLNEILIQAYQEPVDPPVFGPEAGEAIGNRSLFDDVDDYIGWTCSPPKDRTGLAIPGYSGWTRSVTVQWVNPVTLVATGATNTGLKKITVTAAVGGNTIATLVGLRSIAWVDTIPSPTDTTGNHPPSAAITANTLPQHIGKLITFSGSNSVDQDGDQLSYVWDFGDGVKGSGVTVTHSYSAVGSYTCQLTVYDGRGGTSVATISALISP